MSEQTIDPINGNNMPRQQAVDRMMKRLNETVTGDNILDVDASSLSDDAKRVASQLTDDNVSPRVLAGLVRLMDFILVSALGYLIYVFYVRPLELQEQIDQVTLGGLEYRYAIFSLVGGILAVLFIQAADGYSISSLRDQFKQLGRLVGGWTFVFLVFAITAFFFKQGDTLSRVWFGTWFLAGGAALAITRIFIVRYVKSLFRDGRLQRRAILVGGGERAAELIRSLESQTTQELQICGIFDDRADDRSPSVLLGYPKLGTLSDLLVFGRVCKIDMLVVTFPLTAEGRVAEMLKDLWVLPVDIRLSGHGNKLNLRPRSYSYVGSVPFLDIIDKPLADWDYFKKRAFDVFFATLGILVLAPVMALVAIAVRLDSAGPVLFRQTRYGFNNEKISVLKFRSMFHHMADPKAKQVVSRGDPRVTRVGRFIRKTTLDELPQLFNVLRGELSLIGPRPHAVHAHTENRPWEAVVDGYFARHRVKPGISGWAQINGLRGEIRNKEMIQKRVEHDLYYIENWSLLLDLYILFITPFKVLDTRDSY
ncbi:MAG: undecaprenyl-phosphate glucose phosphotransferase [Hyphomicrobiales bacterium]